MDDKVDAVAGVAGGLKGVGVVVGVGEAGSVVLASPTRLVAHLLVDIKSSFGRFLKTKVHL